MVHAPRFLPFRSRMLAAVAACGLTLGGCANLPKPEDISQKVEQVQEYARAACAYVPTFATIAAIFATGKITEALAVANAICAEVTKPRALRSGAGRPTVAGVVIEGKFVRR